MKYKSYFKVVAVFSLALVIATSLWFASPVMLCSAQGGYGGGWYAGTGAGADGPYPGLTLLGSRISSEGVLTEDVTAESFDGLVQLTISRGTRFVDEQGTPINGVIMVKMEDPPPPPAGSNVIGLVYDFGPKGATFEPPATLSFTYDPALLPEGADEKNLVLALWDGSKWVMLDCTVDPDTHTITAQKISHFTVFAILISTVPAAFTVTDLVIVPDEVGVGENVTISALVNNAGSLSGSYEVTLKIKDVAVATEKVMLPGYASQEVTFTTAKDVAGTYTVDVNGLAGTFEVRAVSPPPPKPPAPVLPPAISINWYLIGGILAGCIIIGVVIWLTTRRRRAG